MKSKQVGVVKGYSVREKNGKKTYVSHTYKHNGITILKSKSFVSEEEAKRFYESNKKYRLKRIQEIEEERIKQEEGEQDLDIQTDNEEQCCDTICDACELEQAGLVWLRYLIKKISV